MRTQQFMEESCLTSVSATVFLDTTPKVQATKANVNMAESIINVLKKHLCAMKLTELYLKILILNPLP